MARVTLTARFDVTDLTEEERDQFAMYLSVQAEGGNDDEYPAVPGGDITWTDAASVEIDRRLAGVLAPCIEVGVEGGPIVDADRAAILTFAERLQQISDDYWMEEDPRVVARGDTLADQGGREEEELQPKVMTQCPNCCATEEFEKRGQRRTYHPLTTDLQKDSWSEADPEWIEFDTNDAGEEIIYCASCDSEYTEADLRA